MMPFRFRKIFNLGKGFRLNLSKRGFSASIGKPGSTLNIGKRGIRPTIGIPGSGLSFTPGSSQATTGKESEQSVLSLYNCVVFIVSGLLICLISGCCLGVIFLPSDSDKKPTPTAEAQIPIERIIALTAEAARAQTLAAASPVPTATLAPLQAIPPSETLAAIPSPANTFLPVYSTNTPFILSTLPAANPSGGTCSCSGDLYNCELNDFVSHAQAQSCFEYCKSQGYGDVHGLDRENDGLACENLP